MLKNRYITALVARTDGFEWCTLSVREENRETVGSGFLKLKTMNKQNDSVQSADTNQVTEEKQHSSYLSVASTSMPAFQGAITLGIPLENTFLRVLTFPACDRTEIDGMVRLQMDKMSPFPLDDMEVSYEVLQSDDNGYIVLSVGVKRDFVEDITNRLESLGIIVERIDVDTLGWWRLLRDRVEQTLPKQQMVLIFDHQRIDLIVLENKVPILLRTVAHYNGEGIETVWDDVSAECARTLLWLELQGKVESSVGLYVLHEGKDVNGLLEKLEKTCGIKPMYISLETLQLLPVGLAHRFADKTELNLISSRWYQALQERVKRRTVRYVAMALLGAWIMLVGILTAIWILQKAVLAKYEKNLQTYKTPAHDVLKLKRRMAILNRYMDKSGSALEYLREITSLMPQGLKLVSFTYKKGEFVKISGEAERSELVLGFNERLNSSKMFAHVTAETQTMTPEGKYRFGFNIKLAGAE